MTVGSGVCSLLGAVACSGAGQGSPEALGKAIAAAINDNDATAYENLRCAGEPGEDGLGGELDEGDVTAKFDEVTDESDDTATVVVEVTWQGFENLPVPYQVRKEGDQWCFTATPTP